MMDKLPDILNTYNEIDGWKIIVSEIEASELFFIKQNLDMNRGKKVQHIKITIYKDFEKDNVKYRGSSTLFIYPTMTTDEIKNALDEAIIGAGFVMNRYYPLVKPSDLQQPRIDSNLSEKQLSEWLPYISKALFKADVYEKGGINSAELFLRKINNRIINSNGIDIEFNKYNGQLEFITNWENNEEEIELYKEINFADYNPEGLTAEVNKMLELSRERAEARPTPALVNCTVLLTGEPVKEFLKYYYQQTNARQVYEQISTGKINESVQGERIKGDKLTIKLDPFLKGSTASTPYDKDGYPLKAITIIRDGIIKNFWGDSRYSCYLGIEPTGNIKNIIVEPGKESVNNFKIEPYLELLVFSDFQMDVLTGDFTGEIRLGRYFDGKETVPVTGGSISGNVKDVQEELFLSKESQNINNFKGPRTIKIQGINVAGN